MVFLEGLPKSEWLDSILLVVDRVSKYAHFIGLKHDGAFYSSNFCEVVRLHGVPCSIISDRDKLFISKFWSELFWQKGTKLKYTSAYNLHIDGQMEVVNQGMETYLRFFTSVKLPWADISLWMIFPLLTHLSSFPFLISKLFWVELVSNSGYGMEPSYNTSFHVFNQLTHFRILYGRDPLPLLRFEKGTTAVSSLDQLMAKRERLLEELKIDLLQAQQFMKIAADKHTRAVEFSALIWKCTLSS